MKKKAFLLSSVTACLIAITTLVLTSINQNPLSRTNASIKSYGITFDSERNKFHENTGITAYDGDATIKTDLGNDIGFRYYQLMGTKNTWHVLANGGYFYNTDPIHGIQSIYLSFNTDGASYSISYSNDESFDQTKTFTSKKGGTETFDFDGYQPNYFKILNTSGKNLNIPSIRVSLSCLNNYPTVNLVNENEDMGTIEGSGTKKAGSSVTLTATPNKGYRFLGWYDNDTLMSSESSYTFTIGNNDLSYVARFTYQSYNLVVESESSEKGATSESSGKYNYLDNVTINATPNKGYSFYGWYGWYKGSYRRVSKENPYTFSMPYSDTTYTAKFTRNDYALRLNNENESLGSISGQGTFSYGSNVTITATPNTGVSFLGWYDNDGKLVSSLESYSFKMPYEDILYTAKFEWTPYSVSININDTSMGTVTGDGSYTYGQAVSLVATPNEHYSFFGWYDGENLLSQDSTYSFNMPDKSLSYIARFVKNYRLNVSTGDLSKGSVVSPIECGEGLEVTIRAKANDVYVLDYWYDDDLNEISNDPNYTFTMPGYDVSLYALFTTGGYTFSVSSDDDPNSTVNDVSNRYKEGTSITVVATSAEGCLFKGWYNGSKKVSEESSYTFTMPANDYSLVARFLTKETIKFAKEPIISSDGKTIKYGLYPQTNINDESLVSALNALIEPESNGWYLYEGDYYAKVSASPFETNYKFDNGTTISSGKTYWFRCEPIVWKVLSNDSDEYYIVSSSLLDAHCYYESDSTRTIDGKTVYPNNYEYSDIRKWLNGEFYSSAFALGNSNIQLTTVDNSASTTDSSSNEYSCSNTKDKVFLPSYKDYINSLYGFSTAEGMSNTRFCKTTDWARARGAVNKSHRYANLSGYWTRSASSGYSGYSGYAWSVDYNGVLVDYIPVDDSIWSVRPALSIKIE